MSAIRTYPQMTPQRPDWLAGVGGFELPNDGMFPLFSHRIDNTSRADPQNHRSAMPSRLARLRAAKGDSGFLIPPCGGSNPPTPANRPGLMRSAYPRTRCDIAFSRAYEWIGRNR